MTNYKVFLTDENNNVAELDTEDLQLTTTFQILDITNIAARKDNLQEIKFKGTKNNNNVLGSYFDLGRSTDGNLATNLYFNYNALRPCTALIYEESTLIFKGTIRLSSIQTDRYGNAIYDTVLTGGLIDLKTALNDMLLEDLNFKDLQHRFNTTNIINSWSTATERFNPTTSAYTNSSFAFGSGYIYGDIDYGFYVSASTATTINQTNIRNYKPSLYVKEYIDRIFSQDVLSGYSYTIQGDTDFNALCKKLVVPSCEEGLKMNLSGFVSTYSQTATTVNHAWQDALIPLNVIIHPPTTTGGHLLEDQSYPDVLYPVRNFTSSAKVTGLVSFTYDITPGNPINTINVITKLCKRPAETNNNNQDWVIIGSTSFPITGSYSGTTIALRPIEIDISTFDILQTDQLALLWGTDISAANLIEGSPASQVFNMQLSLPSNANQVVTVDILPNLNPVDILIPAAPANIKQIDFLKSFMLQFNLIAYTGDNPKNIIFEQYDDYYSLFQPQYIKQNAIDWSSKLDYTNGFLSKTNIALPKSYAFEYKGDDVDYFSGYYRNKFNIGYGDLLFNDAYGLVDTKTIELIFSPLIPISDTGSDRVYPALYALDNSNVKKVTKTNIRLGYYNGLRNCVGYTINVNSGNTVTPIQTSLFTGVTLTQYPQVSNYLLDDSGTVINNMQFNRPNEVYISATNDYFTANTAYTNYYINQTSELTNQDVVYLEVNMLLNEIDINNLDLSVPIFLQTGNMGASYFKILKIIYTGSDSISKVSLEKVVLG